MNVTELARILKITPQELRFWLPQFGFDVGQKAIKINRNVANKIIRDWPRLKKEMEKQKAIKAAKEEAEETEKIIKTKSIELPAFITVREFSQLTGLPVNKIITELMKNNIFSSLNEKIDFETAWLVGSELGIEIKKKKEKKSIVHEDRLKKALGKEKDKNLLARAPVIVVMGHVDHGKTKLLDAIRKTNVVDDEAGGITQHIGAYQVVRKGQAITFVDTPGHEAFTAMRSRGAKIADIAILVVAADDGVKPQTIEAYRIIEAAKIPFVVAINKTDKPEANIEKTKQELSNQLKLVPEDWGGKTICVPVSAKEGTGISNLLDMVLLAAETETDNIRANPKSKAIGTIIESNINKGAGPVATILVQNGTLSVGDELIDDNIAVGKTRALYNYKGDTIKEAGPSMPVQIIGLKIMPQVGDIIQVGEGKKVKFKKHKTLKSSSASLSPQAKTEETNVPKINLIIKSDVLGSAEAIEESLAKISTANVEIKIIHKGLGNITDGDIKRAEAVGGIIIGFNVNVPPILEEVIREKNIEVKLFSIIYDLINTIKEKMQELVNPEIQRVNLGKLKVLAIFRTDKESQIVGGKVIEGQIEADSKIEVWRQKEYLTTGLLTKLQSGKEDVNIIETDQECGLQFEGKPIIVIGDILIFYKEKKVIAKIE